MKFFVAIVQDQDGNLMGGYIVLDKHVDAVRPLWEKHGDKNAFSIIVMDGPSILAMFYGYHFV
jgi:hypothetical protein